MDPLIRRNSNMFIKLFSALLVLVGAGLACGLPGISPDPTPLPAPADLAIAPPPADSRLGGLEGIFVSVVSADHSEQQRCNKLYRFFEDGLVLYADYNCFEKATGFQRWAELDRLLDRDNPDRQRGDYYTQDQRLFVRIVEHDFIHEVTYLRSFQGEYCNRKMVLQEPAVTGYAGLPSELTSPVLEYIWPEDTPTREIQAEAGCHVASFRVTWRSYITLAGGRGRFQIQTDPGQLCTLRYTTPEGIEIKASGAGTITADDQGLCEWIWEVGEARGEGSITITIDEITQDFLIHIN
jgi:hypothetical protein